MGTKTIPAHYLKVHAWWNDTLVYSDYFFDMTASWQFDNLDNDVNVVFHELKMIRHSFEQADYPQVASNARLYLLNSMSQVMMGFKEFVAGNTDAARQSMHNAQNELHNLEHELTRLGVPVPYLEHHIH